MYAFRGTVDFPTGRNDGDPIKSKSTLNREGNELQSDRAWSVDNRNEERQEPPAPAEFYAQYFPDCLNDTDDEDQEPWAYAQFFPDCLDDTDDEDSSDLTLVPDTNDNTDEHPQPPSPAQYLVGHPWLLDPWQREQHEMRFCKPPVIEWSHKLIDVYRIQEHQDLEMAQYLSQVPLAYWVIPQEQAQQAYRAMLDRHNTRQLYSGTPKVSALPPVAFTTPGLTNEIHPLLARTQFLNSGDGWYCILEPTMRLASRVLQTPAFIKHLIVIVDGELRSDTGPGGASVATDLATLRGLKDAKGRRAKPKISRHAKADQETVNTTMVQRSKEILAELTAHVRFYILESPDGAMGSCEGPDSSMTSDFGAVHPDRSSLIKIDEYLFFGIQEGYGRRMPGQSGSDNDAELQSDEAHLMGTIVHEVFHAVENMYNLTRKESRGTCESFLGDCRMAEARFAAEAAIFGGVLSIGTTADRRSHLRLDRWPSKDILEDYKRSGSRIGHRPGSGPLYQSHRFVKPSAVQRIFTDQHWTKNLAKGGTGPLFGIEDEIFRPKQLTTAARRSRKRDRAEEDDLKGKPGKKQKW